MIKSRKISAITCIILMALVVILATAVSINQIDVPAFAEDGSDEAEAAPEPKNNGLYYVIGGTAVLLAVIIATVILANKKYRLSFVVGKRAAPVPERKYLGGTELDDLPFPLRYDAKFGGWYNDPYLKEPFKMLYMPKQDVTLYAKWKRRTRR